jgi:signal transduction histidine kinase/CheY-like chemotaxis protein
MRTEETSRSNWAARLEVVGELASLINTTFDLDEIFRTAILKIRRVIEFRRASVVLVSEDRDYYTLHTLYDAARGGFMAREERYPLDRGLTGQAILTGEALRVDAFTGTEGIRAAEEGKVSALIVPIHLDNRVIGALNFGAQEMARYEEEDLELAVLLARQIATSLHNSKLLSTIRRQREELEEQHAHVSSERARLEALIDASDAAILMVSGDRVTYANHPMAELLGLPREVIQSAPLEEINRVLARSLLDSSALAAQTAALRSGDAALRDRVEFQFPRRLVCERTVAAVRGADRRVLGHLVLYRDVTTEAAAAAAKSEFVSIVSHELRTPLTSVKTSLDLLLKGAAGPISEGTRDLLDIALRNLDRLIRLVDDLLDLSRIEAGRVEFKLQPVSLEDATSRAVDAVEAFARERGVQIQVERADGDAMISADPDRLQQVIVNLLSNAIKFSPTGGRVGLRWWKQSDYAVLEISDEGQGIPAERLEEIFDKFRQLEQSATRKVGGAGLGLAISRSIVDQLGGDLWAESAVGLGSKFFVRLRLTSGQPEAQDLGAAVAATPGTLLLVESDTDRQRLFKAQFESEGWQVVVSSRGEEGLDLALARGPDLILTGVELEDMHGLDFVQRLRASPTCVATPTLLVGPGGDPRQAVSYGADGWVVGDTDGLMAEVARLSSAPGRRVVLIIEDDPAVRMGLARGLRRAGYACIEAASGEAGMVVARQRTPDLVMTDVQIPGMDGLMVLREFRADPTLAGVPAIVITGHAAPDLVESIKSLGANFLPKPFGTSTVLREVGKLIGAQAEGDSAAG